YTRPVDLHIAERPEPYEMWRTERTYRHCVQITDVRHSKGSLLAASSTSDNTTAPNYRHASSSGRISIAQISAPLDIPNLHPLQTVSFDRLVGNDRWAEKVAHAQEIGDDSVITTSGLGEIFEEISPIEDYQGTMALSFADPEFSDPKDRKSIRLNSSHVSISYAV